VKPIELLVRSPRWDRATQKAFRAHLAKNMRDAARLEYCRRKADFMMDGGAKRGALTLITWALATFTKVERRDRGLALSTHAQLLEELGDFAAAATAEHAAGKADRSFAASSTHEARALLRASKLVATPEVQRLERRVARDPSARAVAADAVWRHAILAFCAVARRQPTRARTHARQALALAADGATDFERWIAKHRRIRLPAVDLKPRELAALARIAGL
jgi:hypothetical protein